MLHGGQSSDMEPVVASELIVPQSSNLVRNSIAVAFLVIIVSAWWMYYHKKEPVSFNNVIATVVYGVLAGAVFGGLMALKRS